MPPTPQLQKAQLRQVRGVQTFKAWALADGRNRGPEAGSSTEVASVKVRGEKRMIKINA